MSTTTFTNGVTLTDAGWFNDVDLITYDGTTSQILVGGGAGVIAAWTTATGTGSPVRGTSPSFTTGVISASTTLAVFNTVATTVNAFGGASVALNIGHASGTNTILGASTFSQAITHSSTLTQTGALTYGGVALSNAVTGTGNMVLSVAPTFTTGIITDSTSVACFNTIATTVNAFGGASTALNIGHASGTNTILGASTFSQAGTFSSTLAVTGRVTGTVDVWGGSLAAGVGLSATVAALDAGSGYGLVNVAAGTFQIRSYAKNIEIYTNNGTLAGTITNAAAPAWTIPGTLALTATASPTGAGAGAVGQIAWDTSYLYICTATNDWRRVALTDF